MKKILVMGAGTYQLPLIKKVKELGYKAIVVSPLGDYPGLDLADEVVNLDTRDHIAVLKNARRIGIDAVVTAGTDVAVPTIGYLVDELGLNGTGYLAAKRSMDKELMKQCFTEHGVQTAQFFVVRTIEELKLRANEIGFPVMVKAVDSSGSRGITQALSFKNLDAAFFEAKAVSRSENVIVEQYLNGLEIGAQAVVIGDDVVEVFLHSDEITPPPISTPVGHSIPLNLTNDLEMRTKALVRDAVKAVGIRDTISNVDIIIVDNEPFIIEIGARMGATCLAENISIFAGFNAYEFILKIALGQEPRLPAEYKKQANAALLLRVNKTGKVRNIYLPQSTKKHTNLVEVVVDVKVGDYVSDFNIGPDRVGHIIVKANTRQEANYLVKDLAKSIVFDIESE
jgi:biotin carboxylase